MKQCMDADNLHRRLKKIIGQVTAIDRMVDEDVPCEDILSQINAAKSALNKVGQVVWRGISSIVCVMELSMAMQTRPLKALQKLWSVLQICSKILSMKRQSDRAAFFFCLLDNQYPYRYNIPIPIWV